jgi:hypothetical protein
MALITADALAAWPNPWGEMKYARVKQSDFAVFIEYPFYLREWSALG